MNDFQTALDAYRQYHECERLLLSEESERKARTLSVRLEIEQARYEAERERRRALELEREAHQDELTGLANRRFLMPRLITALEEARKKGPRLAVAMLDVDHFKRINDRLSHPLGDIVLRHLGNLLQSLCRETDVVARYGGEEFVLMLPEIPPETALARCEEVRHRVENYPWNTIHPDLRVTISIGLCAYTLPETADAMLVIADEYLYAAKNAGRNCVRSDSNPVP
jgi:diguanylate cyclase